MRLPDGSRVVAVTNDDKPRQLLFHEGDAAPSRPVHEPLTDRPGPEHPPPAAPDQGTGCVTIIAPGRRRQWSAAWSLDETGPHADWFEAPTFREVIHWAFAKTPVVYLREPDGGLTRLTPPVVEPTAPDGPQAE